MKASYHESPKTVCPDLIGMFGTADAADAIRMVIASSLARRHPVRRRILLGYLGGRSLQEIAESEGLSTRNVLARLYRAAWFVLRERHGGIGRDRLIKSLSLRARNCLIKENLRSDLSLRDHVRKYGAMDLLSIQSFGIKSYQEVCDVFGFDPADPVRK